MPHDHPAPAFFLLQAPKNVDHSAIGNAALRHTVHVTVVLVGPTAVGKSSLAAALARRYAAYGQPAEIVNADSMLVYRGMDIGTAKPSEVERAAIRHHVIDVLEVKQAATVAEFQQIFWLEFLHRLWGRLIGLVFALPLAWFWLRGKLPAPLKPRRSSVTRSRLQSA